MNKKAKIAVISALILVGLVLASFVIAKGGPSSKECNDDIDNDGDGDIDMADAGCSGPTDNDETNCGDGVCEGGETIYSCWADCGTIPNSCSDTDGGYVFTEQGTVSGYYYDNYYEYTDSCSQNVTALLTEYYCAGDTYSSQEVDCNSNTTTTCSEGACV